MQGDLPRLLRLESTPKNIIVNLCLHLGFHPFIVYKINVVGVLGKGGVRAQIIRSCFKKGH